MPLYEFLCGKCGQVGEEFFSMDECPGWVDCNKCDGVATKVLPSSYGIIGDTPAWINDHLRAVLQKDGEKPIQTRKEHDRYLKDNGYVQRS